MRSAQSKPLYSIFSKAYIFQHMRCIPDCDFKTGHWPKGKMAFANWLPSKASTEHVLIGSIYGSIAACTF